jgi:hypothetical protein
VVVVLMVAAVLWLVAAVAGLWAHYPEDLLCLFYEKVFAESHLSSQHTCVVGPGRGFRQKALCR